MFDSTKISEFSDIRKCLNTFMYQALAFLASKNAAEIRINNIIFDDMKRFYSTIFLLAISCITLLAQHVSYTYKPLAAEGCSVRYSAIYQEVTSYLFVEIRSDRLVFGNTPTIKFKTFKDEIIELKGKPLATSQESTGVVVGNIVVPATELQAKAQFEITDQQIALLKDGIAKVRINTVPITHERSFKNDKIGKKLYDLFLKAKAKADKF